MLTILRSLLVAAFLLGFVGWLAAFNADKPRILVLHSADESSPWVRDVDAGIRAGLAANRRPVSVAWHYLRSGRHPRDEARVAAVSAALRALARQDPDIVIAVDDESNETLGRTLAGRSRPRLVYASIDQPPARYGYDAAPNVTGIAEELPLAAVRDAILAIRGGAAARIAAVGVATDTGRAELRQVESCDWAPHALVAAATPATFTDWRGFVARADDTADVLLVLTLQGLARSDDDGTPVEATEIVAWVEDHAAPLPIGLHADYVVAGGGFSLSPPPLDYGRRAVDLALRWLDAPQAAPPAPFTSDHFDVAVRSARLAARGVALPPIYLEAARAGGRLITP
jgi:hypothetical protein